MPTVTSRADTVLLDDIYRALADPTRRAIIASLSSGPASVSQLAKPFPMTLAAIVQHLAVLEQSGLVTTKKEGRVRTCRLDSRGLRTAENWIADYRNTWEQRLDRLQALLDEI
jgi:DNA-binding transcriptional ArsR family regulator